MITENIGKLILETQKGVKLLKDQLDEFAKNNINDENKKNVQTMYDHLLAQLKKFESALDSKLDQVYKNILNDNNMTIQRLPAIRTPDAKEKIKSEENQSNQRAFSTNELTTDPLSKLYYKKKVQKFSKPKKFTSLLPSSSSLISLSDSDLNQGLLQLITKGIITKDLNLTKILEGKVASLTNKPIELRNPKEKHMYREISTFSENPGLYNLDSTNLPSKRPSQPSSLLPPTLSSSLPLLSAPERKLNASLLRLPPTSSLLTSSSNHIPSAPTPPQPKFMSYPEILDTYSLHHIVIRKGRVLGETPEFQSYKRICEDLWPVIHDILNRLEIVARRSKIDWLKVDGKKLAKLAIKWKRIEEGGRWREEEGRRKEEEGRRRDEEGRRREEEGRRREEEGGGGRKEEGRRTMEEILEVLAEGGREEVKMKAAKTVQSVWRGYLGRRDFRRLRILIGKVRTIQRAWKGWEEGRRGREERRKRAEEEYEGFLQRMEEFKRDWPEIKLKRRVEVHICSFSFEEMRRLTMEKFVQRQNSQICRIFRLKDPDIEIVYVAPFDLSPELISYYHKILDLAGIPNYKERLHFVWPENHILFPSHSPLSRLLLYSPSSLHRIKLLSSSYPSYIIPGPPSNDDIRLSNVLRLPLLSSSPQLHLVLSTPSSSLSLLSSSSLPLPPTACELFDEAELVDSLAMLITQNPQIDLWFLKIDGENGGRGVALLDLRKIPGLKGRREGRKEEGGKSEEGGGRRGREQGGGEREDGGRREVGRVREILVRSMEKGIQVACGRLWKGYREFLREMERRGGVVEGGMGGGEGVGVSFFVEPNGGVELICAYDKLEGKDYLGMGCSFPSKGLEGLNLKAISETVGAKLFERGLFGFFTVKLVTFPDPKGGGRRLFWAVGLDCYLNQYTCGYFYFDLLMGGRRGGEEGKEEESNYMIRVGDKMEERRFVFIPCMYHPGLSNIQYKTFFHMCRIENVSFDLERKIGASFLLVDSLQSAVISLITVAENEAEVYRFMKEAMNFLSEHCGTIPKYDEFSEISRSDSISFGDIVGKIRLIYKRIEKEIGRKERRIGGKDDRFL